eukprot:3603287-Rhodomonas_salina.1
MSGEMALPGYRRVGGRQVPRRWSRWLLISSKLNWSVPGVPGYSSCASARFSIQEQTTNHQS